jgi:hypothetical protein
MKGGTAFAAVVLQIAKDHSGLKTSSSGEYFFTAIDIKMKEMPTCHGAIYF